MSKKFVRVKKFIIPVLTAAMLLAQATPAFALTPSEVATLENSGYAVEVIMPQATPAGKLGNIVALAETEEFEIQDGKLVKYLGDGDGKDVVIPDGVTEIAEYAFRFQPFINSVTIPDSVTKIGTEAFRGCNFMQKVYVPSSVTEFGVDVFAEDMEIVIHCEEGSAAQAYAEANGVKTVLEEAKPAETPATQPTETPAPQPTETQKPTEGQGHGATQAKQTYTDVPPTFWGYEAIEALSKGGLLQGYGNGCFGPSDPVTTGELATILCRIGGLSTDNADFEPEGKYTEPYNWAHMAMRNIWDTMIYMVKPEYADRAVIRGEAITALVSVARRMPKYHEGGTTTAAPLRQVSEKVWMEADIPDWDNVEETALSARTNGIRVDPINLLLAYNLGIVSGTDEYGTCNAGAGLTRAELCQILYNMGVTRANQVDLGGAFVGR